MQRHAQDVTLEEAARILGKSVDAIRKRADREGWPRRHEGRRVYVQLPEDALPVPTRLPSEDGGDDALPIARQDLTPAMILGFAERLSQQSQTQQRRLEELAAENGRLKAQLASLRREMTRELGRRDARIEGLLDLLSSRREVEETVEVEGEAEEDLTGPG